MALDPLVAPEVGILDLADLASVRTFADYILTSRGTIHLLINNAGVRTSKYYRTRDGFELNFGVSHLGHFALTALLWPALRQRPGARIVNVSSLAHYFGKIRFGDIHWDKGFGRWKAYGMSKLANLLFTRELASRQELYGTGITVTAAHPGYANTDLQTSGLLMAGAQWRARLFNLADNLFGQPAWKGALPVLYAAVVSGLEQGSYFGPGGFLRLRGWPAPERPGSRHVTDESARRLWRVSEELTGIGFHAD
jgi:NAD(P)-dependent dehydrogenase (short-subunit alcohol dehydrogenase family)